MATPSVIDRGLRAFHNDYDGVNVYWNSVIDRSPTAPRDAKDQNPRAEVHENVSSSHAYSVP